MPQQIILVQRVGYFLNFETFALIDYPDDELFVTQCDSHMNLFVPVIAVSVYHGVDHAFSHSHPDTMLLVFIEANIDRGFLDLVRGDVDTFKRRRVFVIEQFFCTGIHVDVSTR